jgi:23S rRNA (cytidine1920-2'-O)/16S rRNA (cytidine1409-2'-O)-methyltransferase
MKRARQRLDIVLVERGLVESREKAQRLILADEVLLNDQPARKASQWVRPDDRLTVKAPAKYVSRGGHKLEHALRYFALDVQGLVVADLGASTGGFTDCLLQHGAAKVYAVDVGKGQLAQRLERDPRVIVLNGVNARHLNAAVVPEPVDLVTVDVSFISLTLVLPAAYHLLKPGGTIVALIKPQFEAGRAEVGRGGVVRNESVRRNVVERIETFARDTLAARVQGVTESPLLGPAGNHEYLICIEKP